MRRSTGLHCSTSAGDIRSASGTQPPPLLHLHSLSPFYGFSLVFWFVFRSGFKMLKCTVCTVFMSHCLTEIIRSLNQSKRLCGVPKNICLWGCEGWNKPRQTYSFTFENLLPCHCNFLKSIFCECSHSSNYELPMKCKLFPALHFQFIALSWCLVPQQWDNDWLGDIQTAMEFLVRDDLPDLLSLNCTYLFTSQHPELQLCLLLTVWNQLRPALSPSQHWHV